MLLVTFIAYNQSNFYSLVEFFLNYKLYKEKILVHDFFKINFYKRAVTIQKMNLYVVKIT